VPGSTGATSCQAVIANINALLGGTTFRCAPPGWVAGCTPDNLARLNAAYATNFTCGADLVYDDGPDPSFPLAGCGAGSPASDLARTATLPTCFAGGLEGGGVVRQTIGKTVPMVASGASPTQQAMEACGWRFAPGTRLHKFCPGKPYPKNGGLQPANDYSRACKVSSDDGTAPAPDPMAMVYQVSPPWRGVVRYTLPSGAGYCGFRLKLYEHYIDAETPAMVELAGRTVWAANDTRAACATVLSGSFEPGDVLTLTERSILALFWLELVPVGNAECGWVPAEVTASECCGDCPITGACGPRGAGWYLDLSAGGHMHPPRERRPHAPCP